MSRRCVAPVSEYDALRRLGVGDAAGFVKRRYGAADLTHLTSCCVGPSVRERLDAELQVLVGSAGWLDAAVSRGSGSHSVGWLDAAVSGEWEPLSGLAGRCGQ